MPRFDLESYVQVKDRIKKFRADHPDWALVSELVHHDAERVIVKASIVESTAGFVLATGLAEEIRDSSPVNKTSPLENCETSAWGRALANLGYEVDKSIASREEMAKAGRAENRSEQAESGTSPPAPPVDPVGEPWMVTLAKVNAFIQPGTPGSDDRRIQVREAAAKAELIKDVSAEMDLAKFDEKQLDAVDQIIVNLTGPF